MCFLLFGTCLDLRYSHKKQKYMKNFIDLVENFTIFLDKTSS